MRHFLAGLGLVLLSAPLTAHAQTYTPVPMSSLAAQVAPIIASQNYAGVHIDQALLGSIALSQVYANQQGQISTVQATAQAAIPAAQKGAASGVAPLDANKNVTNGIATPSMTALPGTSSGQQALFNAGRFPVVTTLDDANKADAFQNPDMVAIGGLPTLGWDAVTGAYNNTQGRPGNLVVTGQPWGPYNAGAIENILWGHSVDQQNGVAALDWRQGAGYIPSSDAVAQFIGVNDATAFAMGTVDHFDAGDVVLSTPLTAAQIATLRIGMYIQTNIVDTTTTNSGMVSNGSGGYVARTTAPLSTNNPYVTGMTTLPTQDWYRGIISGWSSDGVTLRVSCWTNISKSPESCVVPGAATTDVTDQYWTQWGQPMVFIGAAANGSAHNEYLYYDDSKSTGQGTNLSHSMLSDEIDLRYWATKDNSVNLNGINIGVAGAYGTPIGRNALTQDSYLMSLSGDIHNTLILDGPADGNLINGESIYVHGDEGVDTISNGVNRPVQTQFGFNSVVDGSQGFNLMGWLKKDQPTVSGINGASFHLSLNTNGIARTLDPTQNQWGSIVWNNGGTNNGGLSLCGGSGVCPIAVNYAGAAAVYGNLDIAGSLLSKGPGLVGSSGITGGNGFTVGAQPSGYAALIGAYAETGYTNNLLDIEVGGVSEFLVSPDGGLKASGDIQTSGQIVSGNNVTVGQGSALIVLPPSGASGYPRLSAPDGVSIKAATSAGGDANFSAYNVTSSGTFHENLNTPSSSAAACAAGDFTDDANYHYVCVAANTWKRVALSSF